MKTVTADALAKAAAEAFEMMAFLEIRPDPEAPPPPADALRTAIPLLDPFAGRFALVWGRDLAEEIANTLHGGIEGEALRRAAEDVTAELANTIAGRFLGLLIPPGAPVGLGLPQRESGPPPPDLTPAAFQLDDGRRFWLLVSIPEGDLP